MTWAQRQDYIAATEGDQARRRLGENEALRGTSYLASPQLSSDCST